MRGVILGVGLGVLAAKKADSLVKGALLKYLASHATDQVPSPDQAGGGLPGNLTSSAISLR